MGVDFASTRIGQRFLDLTMPKIADQLERMNTNVRPMSQVADQLERLNTNLEALIAALRNAASLAEERVRAG